MLCLSRYSSLTNAGLYDHFSKVHELGTGPSKKPKDPVSVSDNFKASFAAPDTTRSAVEQNGDHAAPTQIYRPGWYGRSLNTAQGPVPRIPTGKLRNYSG